MALDTIRSIGLEITDKCNFDCIHCYLPQKNSNELSVNFVSDVVAKLGSIYDSFFLTGGEPLLHNNFVEIYKTIRKKGYIVNILTNGSILSKSILETFQDAMPHKIEISLYGMSNNTYRNVTRSNLNYDTIKRNIICLKSITNNILLKYILLTKNYHDLEYFVKFSQELNLNYSISTQVIPTLSKNKSILKYRLSANKLFDVLQNANIKIPTVYESEHICDLGDSIFIDSMKCLHGCPIFRTPHDLNVEKSLNVGEINIFIENMKSYRQSFNENICPGWILLEDSKSITSYIKAISDYFYD